jgi:hypothetical protein
MEGRSFERDDRQVRLGRTPSHGTSCRKRVRKKIRNGVPFADLPREEQEYLTLGERKELRKGDLEAWEGEVARLQDVQMRRAYGRVAVGARELGSLDLLKDAYRPAFEQYEAYLEKPDTDDLNWHMATVLAEIMSARNLRQIQEARKDLAKLKGMFVERHDVRAHVVTTGQLDAGLEATLARIEGTDLGPPELPAVALVKDEEEEDVGRVERAERVERQEVGDGDRGREGSGGAPEPGEEAPGGGDEPGEEAEGLAAREGDPGPAVPGPDDAGGSGGGGSGEDAEGGA